MNLCEAMRLVAARVQDTRHDVVLCFLLKIKVGDCCRERGRCPRFPCCCHGSYSVNPGTSCLQVELSVKLPSKMTYAPYTHPPYLRQVSGWHTYRIITAANF